MIEDGLISIEFVHSTRTMTFVYEPGTKYSLREISEYVEDSADKIIIREGDEEVWSAEYKRPVQ